MENIYHFSKLSEINQFNFFENSSINLQFPDAAVAAATHVGKIKDVAAAVAVQQHMMKS